MIELDGGGGGLVTKLCPIFATPWTVAHQAPLSMEFSRQGYWSGLPFPQPTGPTGGDGLVAKSCPTLVTPWTVACQAPLSMRLSRQEYWSGLPFLSPGGLPNPGVEPRSPAL